MKRIDQLTATRFISVMFILYAHGGASRYIPFANHPIMSAILASAPTVVGFLYVLSGFVMSLAYYKPGVNIDTKKFWTARFVRIYPLYIISFLMTCYFYLDGLAQIKPQKVLANLFLLQAWSPIYSQSFNIASWSLTVEIFFYAIFPLLIYWSHKQSTQKLIWSAIALWAVSQLIYHYLWIGYFPDQRGLLLYNPLFHLNSFVMGVFGGIWFLREGRQQEIRQSIVLGVFFGSLFLVTAYAVVSRDYFPILPHGLQPMAGLLAPMLVLVMSSLSMDRTIFSRLLSNPVFVNLGEAAYGIYIFHVPLTWLYERALANWGVSSPYYIYELTFIPIIFAMGLLARAYVDPPMGKWLKRFINSINTPVLLLDYVIIAASIVLSFRFRFGDGREYLSYKSMGLTMFWTAFLLRPVLNKMFGGLSPDAIYGPLKRTTRSMALSTATGSFVLFVIVYIGYALGRFENFPRSVFVYDWLIVFGLSMGTRLIFKGIFSFQRRHSSAEAV